MAINFAALLRYAPAAARGLSAYRQGKMAGEQQRKAAEIEQNKRLFDQFARRRQLEQGDRQLDQRATIEADRLENARRLREMQEAGQTERRKLQDEVNWFKARSQFGREGDKQEIGQPQRIATERNETQRGMNDADNAAAMARALLAAQTAVQNTQTRAGAQRPRAIPQGVVQSINTNQRQMRIIDEALSELDRRPDAVGLKGYTPGFILDRMDPKGVNARAAIADVGSLEIRDRSGAAVTASEFPRLRPFIPSDRDDTETVRKKLARMKQIIAEETEGLSSFYSEDQGYVPMPRQAQPSQPQGGGAAPPATETPAQRSKRLQEQSKR